MKILKKMKNNILLMALVFCMSCGNVKHMQTTQKQGDFDWLVGEWIRTNKKPGQTTYENWERLNQQEYKGKGFTIAQSDNDTLWSESLQLIKDTEHWSFNVLMKGEKEATKFALTHKKETQFICANQQNDFPKVIAYEKVKDTLVAKFLVVGMRFCLSLLALTDEISLLYYNFLIFNSHTKE